MSFVIYLLQKLNNNSLPVFLDQLSSVTVNFTKEVVESTPTITAIVDILENVGERMILLFIPITKTSIEVHELIQKSQICLMFD